MTDTVLAEGQWSADQANAWHRQHPWICGFNFLPSSAVNFLEMWREDGFDADEIRQELGWAADLGLNALRTNLHYLVWKHDRDGLMRRLDTLLDIASGLDIASVIILFDDCGFGGDEPVWGPQPDPIPNVHNSRAVASPGRAAVIDGSEWADFERYVRDVVAAFRDDPRILIWDVYNEPGNGLIFTEHGALDRSAELDEPSMRLMRDSFRWVRLERPSQPVMVGAWRTAPVGSDAASYEHDIDREALALSDLVSFHAYHKTDRTRTLIDALAAHGRPMYCTEWMARAVGSRINDQLHLFRDRGVGCFHWGLVQGRTQTHLPWPKDVLTVHGGVHDPDDWFHDLLRRDGTPYDPEEAAIFRALAARDAT